MEVIRINRERVKIMLTPYDMDEMQIDCDMLDSFDGRGREAFGKIMREAREKCGFISSGRKIFVQIFPSRDGGCEMFITKMSEPESIGRAIKKRKYIYRFPSMNALIGLCSALSGEYYKECAAYYDEVRREYFLELPEELSLCGEFGGMRCKSDAEVYLKERCRLFCKDAVKVLGGL